MATTRRKEKQQHSNSFSSYREPEGVLSDSDQDSGQEEEEENEGLGDPEEEEEGPVAPIRQRKSRGLKIKEKEDLYKLLELHGGPWNFTKENRLFDKLASQKQRKFGSGGSTKRKQFSNRIQEVQGKRGFTIVRYVEELKSLHIQPSINTLNRLEEHKNQALLQSASGNSASGKKAFRSTPSSSKPIKKQQNSSSARKKSSASAKKLTSQISSPQIQGTSRRLFQSNMEPPPTRENNGGALENYTFQTYSSNSDMPNFPVTYQNQEFCK